MKKVKNHLIILFEDFHRMDVLFIDAIAIIVLYFISNMNGTGIPPPNFFEIILFPFRQS